jgi:hypothetical protein
MNKSAFIVLLLSAIAGTASACYAAPGIYTGWCNFEKGVYGSRSTYVNYCFDIAGEMTIHCQAMASNYPDRGPGQWDAYDIGVINDGDCVRMYWGPVAASPGVRCWSYGLPVHFRSYLG